MTNKVTKNTYDKNEKNRTGKNLKDIITKINPVPISTKGYCLDILLEQRRHLPP